MKTSVSRFIGICLILFGLTRITIAQTISINMDSAYQTIRGFGGIHITSWQGTDLNEDLREKAFDNDPGELGLSILRLQIDPDSNRFDTELEIAQYAVEKGAIVFASPWDPPAEMLDPASSQHRLHEDYYDDYAAHLTRYYTHMIENGVPIYAISVQNEPDWDGGWTQWTAEEMIKFLEENAQTIPTQVMAPESYKFDRPYTDALLNDPEASANLDIVAGHIYGGGLVDYPHCRDHKKEAWMTEHYTSSDRSANLWPDALLVGSELNIFLESNFHAYVWWYIRRFYGLITDDGAISKRGYVFSHFSKFIRPGATRVDVTPDAKPGVDATAFKTDSTLVVVVINSNASEVNLDFAIQNNIGIDTLTKFTTSETKNVVNDGGINIAGDIFSATVDPYSITTFTSYAENGGKSNNIHPVAMAGEDIVIEDIDGNGSEIITLDGTASNDPDGIITNYSWSVNGMQVAWESSPEITLDVGAHMAVLTVTDDDGATHADTILIAIISPYNTEIWLEAECGIVGSTWEINTDENASYSEYVNSPGGTQSIDEPSTDTADHLIYTFQVDEAGGYKVWARVITPSYDDDSYWVKMDTNDWVRWNGIAASVGSEWGWDDVHDDNGTITYELETGSHTLSICYREDGALLDKLYLTNTGIIPTGIGEEDETCPEKPDAINQADNSLTKIEVFPNPAQNEIQVSWSDGFTSLLVVSLEGKIIIQRNYPLLRQQLHLALDLEPGMYLLLLKKNPQVCLN